MVLPRNVLYHRTERFTVANLTQHDFMHYNVGCDFGHLATTVGLAAARSSFLCEFAHSVAKINHISFLLIATISHLIFF